MFAIGLTLLANVLPGILHKVLLIARVKISRYCSTIDFTEDYFRQQSRPNREPKIEKSGVETRSSKKPEKEGVALTDKKGEDKSCSKRITFSPMNLERLKEFRQSADEAMGKAKDAVFELMDAVLLTRSVSSFVELSLSPVFRRQWSSLYEAIYDSRPQQQNL